MTADPAEVAVADITVGERHRQTMGDLAPLAESIAELGMLHPVVLTPDLTLVAGERRLHAAASLGWTRVPCRIVRTLTDAADLLAAERDENTCRLDMTPFEEHALYRAILAVEKPKAEQRQVELGRSHGTPSGKLPQGAGRAKETAARGTSLSRRTHDKLFAVEATAQDESQPPTVREAAVKAKADIERTGKVDKGFRDVAKAKVAAGSDLLGDYLADDQNLQDLGYMAEFCKATAKATKYALFDAERVGRLADDDVMTSLRHIAETAQRFQDEAKRARSGMRSIAGGRK